MKYYTMKEVQDILGMSRNTIYAYLKRGVVNTPIAKNRKGHLLFDDHQLSMLQNYKGIDDRTPVEYINYIDLVEEDVKEDLPKETSKSSSPFKKGTGKIKTPFKSNKPTREDFYGK